MPEDPQTLAERRETVDAAHVLLLIASRRTYSLMTATLDIYAAGMAKSPGCVNCEARAAAGSCGRYASALRVAGTPPRPSSLVLRFINNA